MKNIFGRDPFAIHWCTQYDVLEFNPNPQPLGAEELERFLPDNHSKTAKLDYFAFLLYLSNMKKTESAVLKVREIIDEKRGDVPFLDFLRKVINTAKPGENSNPAERAKQRVIARGLIARKKLEGAEGGSYSSAQVAEILGNKNRQSVDYQRSENNLVAWRASAGKWRYPVWQFTQHGPLPGVKECLHALETKSEWENMIFFLSKRESLGGKRPLDLLHEGRIEEAVVEAERDGGHGPQ